MQTGFYKIISDTTKNYSYETFCEMLNTTNSEVYVNGEVCPVSVSSFLFGYCVYFAKRLKEEFGYAIEVLCFDIQDMDFVHMYNVTEVNGKKVYIDSRGITDSLDIFLEIYTPCNEKKEFLEENDDRVKMILRNEYWQPDEISDAMCDWCLNNFRHMYDVSRLL